MVLASGIDIVTGVEDINPNRLDTASHRGQARRTVYFSVAHPETGIRISCSLTDSEPGAVTMRHHHVFEQVRYICAGNVYFGQHKYPPGTLIYTPESVYYGPQARREATRILAFQFPGPSNLMPLSLRQLPEEEFARGLSELRAAGVSFDGGVARFPNGKKQEPAEAIYEHLAGRALTYAPPRYADPIYMQTPQFPWCPTNQPGVRVKHLAYFNEGGPNLTMVRLEPGATMPGGHSRCFDIRVVLEGDVQYGGQTCPAVSRLYFPPDSAFEPLSTHNGAELLVFQIAAPDGPAPSRELF